MLIHPQLISYTAESKGEGQLVPIVNPGTCKGDNWCKWPTPVCVNGKCAQCMGDVDCSRGQICKDGVCIGATPAHKSSLIPLVFPPLNAPIELQQNIVKLTPLYELQTVKKKEGIWHYVLIAIIALLLIGLVIGGGVVLYNEK